MGEGGTIAQQIENIYSVSEITQEIKDTLEYGIPPVWVQGEISNFVHHSSGHMYFSLKDENAQIACVLWRSRSMALPFSPENGQMVNAYGQIRVYEKRGTYQLDVQKMAPLGLGDLQMAFEALKQRLRDEGLFDEEHKKPLPAIPQCIGIITSPTGAAIRDIVSVLNNRLPAVEKILRPAQVQGEDAAEDLARAVRELNDYGKVDLIILGRGGGSLEDLWAFNEEVLARAIFDSKIPVISAVGHQIDFAISDFVADVRAATPSAAAEIAVPDRIELKRALDELWRRINLNVMRLIRDRRQQLYSLIQGYAFKRALDRYYQTYQRLDDLMQTISFQANSRLIRYADKFTQLQQRLHALHPQAVLQRGYALVMNEKQSIIREAKQLAIDATVNMYFARGSAKGRIFSTEPDSQFLKWDRDGSETNDI